jgi:hypothetical protein
MSGTADDDVFAVRLPPRPYPGLRPFEKGEWPIFFGRERMADEIVARLLERRLLVVHGDSGCGKSSLVRAGVLPRLEQESARGGGRWRTCSALPREAPLWNLARALAMLDGGGPEEGDVDAREIAFRRALNFGREAPAALARLLGAGPGNQVCILIDQFEELFDHARRHGPEEAMRVTECLVGLLASPPPGLHAVLTMRSEFLGVCSRFPGFAEAVNASQYLLPRMDDDDLLRAIREPATLYDGEVSRELAGRLIADSGGGQDQLPLIQHGLMLLYDGQVVRRAVASLTPLPTSAPDAPPASDAVAAAGPSWRLGLEHYRPARGLVGLLSDHADAVLDAAERRCLPAGGPGRAVEDMFRALTDINADGQAIRRPCTLAQLVAVTGADETILRCILDAFRADGVSFLKPYGSETLASGELIDISHEALIRCWRRIAEPREGWLIREFRNGLVWRALLVQADSFERDAGNVLGPTTTDERERWLRRRNPSWAERYGGGWERVQRLIAASVEARERRKAEAEAARRQEEEARRREERLRRRARRLGALLVVLGVTSALGLVAWQQSVVAERELAEARRQFEAATAAREAEAAARARNEALAHEARQSAEALSRVVVELNVAVNTSDLPPATGEALQKTLSEAQTEIMTQARNLSQAAPVPTPPSSTAGGPRIYFQIADPNQHETARALELRLEARRVGDAAVVVPGIEVVKVAPPRSVLRCFKPEECRGEGEALVKTINALLRTPRVALEDVSVRYGGSSSIRPRHYELWFAPGEIRLAEP